MTPPVPDSVALQQLKTQIRHWSGELGFDGVGISDTQISTAEQYLFTWLKGGYHGEMDYLARHGTRRSRPAELIPGTNRVIGVRMNYWCDPTSSATPILSDPEAAYISRYALGRDYHKMMRRKLQKLADRITVLHYGEVVSEGTPHEVRADPSVQANYLGTDKL